MKRSKLMKGLALSSLLFVMAACANGEGEEESAEAETNTEAGKKLRRMIPTSTITKISRRRFQTKLSRAVQVR